MKLMIYTQICENYGTVDEPYWKMKGGDEYVVNNVSTATANLLHIEKSAVAHINYIDKMYQEWVIGCELVEDDFLTEYEKLQLAYDGSIVYPAKELNIGETA